MNKYNLELDNAEFNKNGLASKSGWVKTYIAHPETGEFIGSTMEHVYFDVSVSAGAYIDAPQLPESAGLAVVRSKDKKAWEIVADYRNSTAYNTETRQAVTIEFIGELPGTLTLLTPQTEFDKWNGTEWVTDTEAQHAAAIADAENKKSALLRTANEKIDYLQDAVDVGLATDAEVNELTEWKKYRVLLSRIDVTNAPDIDWPVRPE
ncbi:tail fiber assembly protein [Yersinia phage vB_YpM_MHG51]|uniref:Tail fiber assembly protein n=2 Tax=unclassified Eganvirus TaxID=2748756 RepID=A0AAX4M771_9CAUD